VELKIENVKWENRKIGKWENRKMVTKS